MTDTVATPVESAPRPKGGVATPNYFPGLVKNKYGKPAVESWNHSYAGAVLSTYERNGYDDSDFFAVVYDAESDSLKHVEYASTRGYTYDCSAQVDATEEVKAKAREVVRRAAFARMTAAAVEAAKAPEVGKTVTVTGGRKVPKGTTGTVVWKGESAYGKSKYGTWGRTQYRVGVKDAEGTVHFTATDNVTVVDPQEYMTGFAELEQRAARYADGNNWRQY